MLKFMQDKSAKPEGKKLNECKTLDDAGYELVSKGEGTVDLVEVGKSKIEVWRQITPAEAGKEDLAIEIDGKLYGFEHQIDDKLYGFEYQIEEAVKDPKKVEDVKKDDKR
jgi:hypothetical protein